jgi:hypothetical protein
MVWIAYNNIERTKSISELVNRLSEYEKALSFIKSPTDKVIQALKEQFHVVGSVDALQKIDALLGIGRTAKEPENTLGAATTDPTPKFKQTAWVDDDTDITR